MFKKNTHSNPWITFAYAMVRLILTVFWGYWAITGIQQKNILLAVVSAFCFVTFFADCVKLLLRADQEATEDYLRTLKENRKKD